jgi:hypothetical protein
MRAARSGSSTAADSPAMPDRPGARSAPTHPLPRGERAEVRVSRGHARVACRPRRRCLLEPLTPASLPQGERGALCTPIKRSPRADEQRSRHCRTAHASPAEPGGLPSYQAGQTVPLLVGKVQARDCQVCSAGSTHRRANRRLERREFNSHPCVRSRERSSPDTWAPPPSSSGTTHG